MTNLSNSSPAVAAHEAAEKRLAAAFAHLPTPPGEVQRWHPAGGDGRGRYRRWWSKDLDSAADVIVASCGMQYSDGESERRVYLDCERGVELTPAEAVELAETLMRAAQECEESL